MTEQDAELEREIDLCFMRLQHTNCPDVRREALDRMQELIAQRSPARIKEMEREWGL